MPNWLRNILIALGLATLFFFVWYLRSLVTYIIISWVLSLIGDPLVDFFCQRKFKKFTMPRGLVAALTVLITWSIIILVFVLLIPVVIQQFAELSKINVQDIITNLQEPISRIEIYLRNFHLIKNTSSEIPIETFISGKIVQFIDISNLSDALGFVTGLFGNIFVAIFSISFITFFFLKEEELFSEMLLILIPKKYEEHTLKALSSIKRLLSRYFTGISIEIILIVILVTIGMLIVGLEFQHALIIGVFAGFINVIPYVGPLLGILFGLFIGIVSHLELDFFAVTFPLLGYILIVFIVVQLMDNILFQPFIYSSSVDAHPLEIFLVIMAAANLVGVGGMILAVPTYTVLRVVLKEFFSQFRLVRKITEKISDE